MNILFVCTGNISRSFFAEMLLKNKIRQKKLDKIYVSSAGVSALEGNPPDSIMVDSLSEMEVTIENHEAKQITKEQVDWADLILVMEKYHLKTIYSKWPKSREKIEPLGKYVSEDQLVDDIIDPYGKTTYHYRLARSQIIMAVDNLLKKILSDQYAKDQIHSH